MRLPRPIGRALVASCAAVLGSACSLLIDVSHDQCTSDGDCTARGPSFAEARCVRSACVVEAVEAGPIAEAGAPDVADAADGSPLVDPRYTCLDKHPAPVASKMTASYQVTLTDLLSQNGVPGLRVKICPNLTDPSCTAPSATTLTDASGIAKLTIDISKGPFDGYVAVVPETADGGTPKVDGSDPNVYVPSRIYYSSLIIADDRVDDYQVMQYSTLLLFANVFQAKADFTKGVAFLIAQDCATHDSADRMFAVDQTVSATFPFYLKNDQPSTTATKTDPSGIGGFINLPVGSRQFTSSLVQPDGTTRPVGGLTGYVSSATILLAKIGPSYKP